MATIVLDDPKISIPKRLKILSFLAEIQKKAPQQYIYVINEKEVAVFTNVNEIKKGMWRRYKLPDIHGYYYIDPETQNEITLFSEEFANKLGTFPYEGPPLKKEPLVNPNYSATLPSALQSTLQSTLPSTLTSGMQGSAIPSALKLSNMGNNPNAYQATIKSLQLSALQPPVVAAPLSAPPTSSFTPFMPYSNSLYSRGQQNQNNNSQQQQQSTTSYMSARSIDNLNRILSFQSSTKQNNPYDNQNIYTNWNGNSLSNLFTSQGLEQQGQIQQGMQQQPVYQTSHQSNQNQAPLPFTQLIQPNYNDTRFNIAPLNQLQQQQLQQQQQQDQQLYMQQPIQQRIIQPQQLQQPNYQPHNLQQPINPIQQQPIQQQQGQQTVQQQGQQLSASGPLQQKQQVLQQVLNKEKTDAKLRYFPPYAKKKSTASGAPPNKPVQPTSTKQEQSKQRLQLQNSAMTNTAPQPVQSQFSA